MDNRVQQFWAGLFKEFGSAMEIYRHTGLTYPVSGGAKGYNETADIPFHTVDGYDLSDLYDEFNETIRILNSQRNPLIDRLTFEVTRPVERIQQLAGDEFEEADEYGQPKRVRLGPFWDLGFDLKYFDLGISYTYRFLGEATAAQVRALNNQALEADGRLIFKTVLERVFRNVIDTADLRGGTAVNVHPFYNGSFAVAPPGWKTYAHTTSHDHYLVSGGATVDAGDLNAMEAHIHHHGYTQGATLILLANRQEINTIATFTRAGGARWDFIPKAGISFLGSMVGGQPTNPSGLSVYPGFQGQYGNINIIEEDYVPAGYMVLFASGGLRADRNPIGLRQHDNESLRGLKLIPRHMHYPLVDSFYHHPLGAGVRHPGAGVIMQVKASGNYEIPALSLQGPGGR